MNNDLKEERRMRRVSDMGGGVVYEGERCAKYEPYLMLRKGKGAKGRYYR